MSQDNPFEGDGERTVIRPSPGGRRGPAAPPPGAGPFGPAAAPVAGAAPPPGRGFEPAAGPQADLTVGGLNPLVGAAAPLLGLAARLRNTPMHHDIEGLRQRVIQEIREFERRITGTSIPPEALRAGHYAICATIDDVINNTPWGANRGWARQSMALTFHNDGSGGERFFEFLNHFHKEPGRYGEVLELMYLCISLGFEGRLRVAPRGAADLARFREGLHKTLRQRRGEAERELSPRWKGVEAAHRPLTSALPGWVVGLAAAAILTVAFIGFSYALNGISDEAYAAIGGLPPQKVASLQTAQPAPPPAPKDGILQRLSAFLAPEVQQRLVSLSETNRTVTIRIRGTGMFGSGSAALSHKFEPLLNRIGEALNTEPGSVLIAGHTDNVPIRSVRFPSNFHLSTARAETVRDMLKKTVKDPARLSAEGRADSEPVAPNTTPEGREANRRIEVILTKPEVASK